MSVAGATKSLLAILLLLPQGTFRALDHYVCRTCCGCDQKAAPRFPPAASESVPRGESESSGCDPAPGRYRTWSDLTFVAAESSEDLEGLQVASAPMDAFVSAMPSSIVLKRAQQGAVPPLNAHSTTRGLLLAKCELRH